jgi:hypothetical protein
MVLYAFGLNRSPVNARVSRVTAKLPPWGMRRNWRKIYGGINIKVRVLADFLAIILVLPEKSRLLLKILTNQSSVTY